MERRRATRGAAGHRSGQKIAHPISQTINNYLKMPPKIHWNIPLNIHWTSDNPLEHTTDTRNYIGRCH